MTALRALLRSAFLGRADGDRGVESESLTPSATMSGVARVPADCLSVLVSIRTLATTTASLGTPWANDLDDERQDRDPLREQPQ